MGVILTREQLEGGGVVKRLERIDSPSFLKKDFGSFRSFFRLESCKKLEGVLSPVVIAPVQAGVHQVAKEYRNRELILFVYKDGFPSVYASLIDPKKRNSTGTGYRNV